MPCTIIDDERTFVHAIDGPLDAYNAARELGGHERGQDAFLP